MTDPTQSESLPAGPRDSPPRVGRWLRAALLLEVANASYLAGFDSATIFYHVQVVLHVVLGLLLILSLLAWGAARLILRGATPVRIGMRSTVLATSLAALLAAGTAIALAVTGTATPWRPLLQLHVASSVLALAGAVLCAALGGRPGVARRAATILSIAVAFPLLVRAYRLARPEHPAKIENPAGPPLGPFQEGAGAKGKFFPSSVQTVGDRLIPHDFFLESKSCGNRGCHPDITAQWSSSMHHFSSFNNQWYRKSIEYMQDVVGTGPSKWCGGCHDQAVLLTGRMDVPIREQIRTPQAQAGIGCLVCHSIVQVPDTMGQGGYVLEYPEMHRLVASRSPILHGMHDYMVRLDPGPHKATMLKPFHRQSRAEFCSACHKVHLDVPVNHYRWFRGFNEYDAWQGSGVSGQGARAFYYPGQPKDCADCHMPLVASNDQGNVEGFVHSHRFPGANTAVPFANHDEEQLKTTRDFLAGGVLTVDIFAATEETEAERRALERMTALFERARRRRPGAIQETAPPGPEPAGAAGSAEPQAASFFPDLPDVGGPGGATIVGPVPARGAEVLRVMAPLNRARPFLRAGQAYRVDVVARTRGVGHFFPGGTVDAFDVWLELKVEDADGRVVSWSGYVEEEGRGPVEIGAHRYRSLMVDAHGNSINKRNAWAARALVYARLIPPGAADVARFQVVLPRDVKGPLTFTARMNYRKFSWYNTQFSYAGARAPQSPPESFSPDYDDGPFVFKAPTSDVSGAIKSIPDLPVTVVAEDKVTLALAPPKGEPPAPPVPQPFDRERYNDYGIGMLLQGDLVAAGKAFEEVTAIDPSYADGFVNRGRVLVQEGDDEAALPVLQQALSLDADKASAHYFLALALKARGRYDDALDHLRAAADRFPRDRVVRNQIGRILFLQRRHQEAVAEFETTLRIDPEDLTAHYNLMLCYRALGNEPLERREETLYTRFKADESAQSITGGYRRLNPEDNLERQPIHEHVSRYSSAARAGMPRDTAGAGR
jgi:Tetratricopeptide repeat/Cytochrome c554 and c-prime